MIKNEDKRLHEFVKSDEKTSVINKFVKDKVKIKMNLRKFLYELKLQKVAKSDLSRVTDELQENIVESVNSGYIFNYFSSYEEATDTVYDVLSEVIYAAILESTIEASFSKSDDVSFTSIFNEKWESVRKLIMYYILMSSR